MVDKAFVVGVDDLHELCRELKNYSLSVTGRNVTITQHDSGNGLNDISFAFPIVADFSILSALHKNPECGLQVCLHVYTRREVRKSLHLEDDDKCCRTRSEIGRVSGILSRLS
jgi:hypothetical protein